MVRIAIVGSRDFPDEQVVKDFVAGLPEGDEVISGGAEGVDTWAVEQAKADGRAFREFIPMREIFGSQAPWYRNHDIVNNADRLVAFIHNASKGSHHAVELAEKRGIPVRIYHSRLYEA